MSPTTPNTKSSSPVANLKQGFDLVIPNRRSSGITKAGILTAMFVVVVMAGGRSAQAQWYVGPDFGYAGYLGYGLGGASTPESAAGHAFADITRSEGIYEALSSQANINNELARGKYIENQKQWTEVYVMKQRALDAQHARQRELTLARNARRAEYQANQPSSLPARLGSSELDPETGRIVWPSALMRDTFAPQREQISTLLKTRGQAGSNSELTASISQNVRGLQDDLRKQIRQIVAQEYMDARRFLDRLSLEGRFPTS